MEKQNSKLILCIPTQGFWYQVDVYSSAYLNVKYKMLKKNPKPVGGIIAADRHTE